MKKSNAAEILLRNFSPEHLERVIGEFDTSGLAQESRTKTKQPNNILDDDENFINEDGEFSGDLKLYSDNEGEAAFAFHGLAGEVVRKIDPHTEADPKATLITFLSAFGNIIGDSAHFTAGSRKHPARIFTVVVGATGKGRKGTSLSPVRHLFNAINPEWEKENIVSGLSSGEGIIHAIRDEETKKVPITEGKGKEKRIVDYEVTISDEGVKDKRMFVIEEEFGKTLRVAKREGNTLSAIIRELWDTGSPRTLTKVPLRATNSHVSILGQITQEELKKEFTSTDLVNGLANRFLWLTVKRSKLLPSGGDFHNIDISMLVNKIKEAIEFASITTEITRDDEAEKLWEEVYGPLSTGAGGLIGAVTSRAEAQTMRLACIYALLDQSHVIKPTHLKAALDLWKFSFKSARFIFGNEAVLEHPNAMKLLRELKARKGRGMTRNEVREFFNRNLSKKELDFITDELISNGFIRVGKVRMEGAKKPTQIITLLE
ncbi:DUF3987 domain-containing protein [Halobacillus mangrovi]|uniref:DUF3987 domain-containing protein n=1 Tax=Halobacillus mangrovi TaxID=402384 RepID=A0A1W5ZZR6_9BACI|nr:DUF3987 domain-containing protein [Halobacillus mangrovi]ARI78808.1 hypothetical protein HM131_19065 [Halobacillus mangrovi]